MQQCIADCIKEKIFADAQASPAIGIMADESIDISVTKSLVIYYIWYLDPIHEQYKTSFLSLTEVPSGTADVIAEAIKKELSSSAIPLAKCCGFSSDGAKVMVGKQNGVAALLKRENTSMIDVHCIAYRIALAFSQSSESYPEAMRFQKQLSAVYTYFAHSAVRMHKLIEIELLLNDPIIRPQKLYENRWLSMYTAVDAIHKCLPSLITVISNEAAAEGPTALGLHKTVTSFRFLVMLHLYNDVLLILSKLSKTFQVDDVSFASIQPTVLSVTSALEDMMCNDGAFLKAFFSGIIESGKLVAEHSVAFSDQEKTGLSSFKQSFLSTLIVNLKTCFPDLGILSAFKILDP